MERTTKTLVIIGIVLIMSCGTLIGALVTFNINHKISISPILAGKLGYSEEIDSTVMYGVIHTNTSFENISVGQQLTDEYFIHFSEHDTNATIWYNNTQFCTTNGSYDFIWWRVVYVDTSTGFAVDLAKYGLKDYVEIQPDTTYQVLCLYRLEIGANETSDYTIDFDIAAVES